MKTLAGVIVGILIGACLPIASAQSPLEFTVSIFRNQEPLIRGIYATGVLHALLMSGAFPENAEPLRRCVRPMTAANVRAIIDRYFSGLPPQEQVMPSAYIALLDACGIP